MRKIAASLILLTVFSIYGFSQAYNPTQINRSRIFNIDTVHFLPAIGYIGVPQRGRMVPNDSLNDVFISKLKTLLPLSADYKIDYIARDSVLNESTVKFLVKTIPFLYRL